MPIGLATKPIEDQPLDLFSPSVAEPYLGVAKKQPTVVLSSTEEEYRGAAVAACEAIWFKRILKDLGVPIKDPTSLYCDNMSNIYLARNPVCHARTKHIEVHYHFI